MKEKNISRKTNEHKNQEDSSIDVFKNHRTTDFPAERYGIKQSNEDNGNTEDKNQTQKNSDSSSSNNSNNQDSKKTNEHKNQEDYQKINQQQIEQAKKELAKELSNLLKNQDLEDFGKKEDNDKSKQQNEPKQDSINDRFDNEDNNAEHNNKEPKDSPKQNSDGENTSSKKSEQPIKIEKAKTPDNYMSKSRESGESEIDNFIKNLDPDSIYDKIAKKHRETIVEIVQHMTNLLKYSSTKTKKPTGHVNRGKRLHKDYTKTIIELKSHSKTPKIFEQKSTRESYKANLAKIDYIMVLDRSASMGNSVKSSGEKFTTIASELAVILMEVSLLLSDTLERLDYPRDRIRMGIYSFSHDLMCHLDLNDDPKEISKRDRSYCHATISGKTGQQGTNTDEALRSILMNLKNDPKSQNRQRVVLLIDDTGAPNVKKVTEVADRYRDNDSVRFYHLAMDNTAENKKYFAKEQTQNIKTSNQAAQLIGKIIRHTNEQGVTYDQI